MSIKPNGWEINPSREYMNGYWAAVEKISSMSKYEREESISKFKYALHAIGLAA